MIGKSEWFTRRKYTGWGLTPKTWHGYVYIVVCIGLGMVLNFLPVSENVKTIGIALLITTVVVDILHVMATMTLDERETKIEALSERNASWTMVGSLAMLVVYVPSRGVSETGQELMPFIIAPLVLGVLVKAISNSILSRTEL